MPACGFLSPCPPSSGLAIISDDYIDDLGICVCMDYENELKNNQRPKINESSKIQKNKKVQKTAIKTNDYKNKLRSS